MPQWLPNNELNDFKASCGSQQRECKRSNSGIQVSAIVLFPDPNNPSADRFQYLMQDTESNPRWGCLDLGTRLSFSLIPSDFLNAGYKWVLG